MLSDTTKQALIRIAGERLPDETAFDNFIADLRNGKISTSDSSTIDAVAILSRMGVEPDERLAKGFDPLSGEERALSSEAHDFLCRFVDSWILRRCTLLGRIARKVPNLDFLKEAAAQPGGEYLAQLILNSLEIFKRQKQPWTYKSLADYGEEMFIRRGNEYGIIDPSTKSPVKNWEREAQEELSQNLSDVITFASGDEGLHLYAPDGNGGFERIKEEDSDYSFIVRFLDEAGTRALNFYSGPPEWATRLHMYYPNWRAHDLMYRSCPSTNNSSYRPWKDAHRRAVLLETQEQERKAALPNPTRGNDVLVDAADEVPKLHVRITELEKELAETRLSAKVVSPDWTQPFVSRSQITLGEAARIISGFDPYGPDDFNDAQDADIRRWWLSLADAADAGKIQASTWSQDRGREQMLSHADIRLWCAKFGHPWPIPSPKPQPVANAEASTELDDRKASNEQGLSMPAWLNPKHPRSPVEMRAAHACWEAITQSGDHDPKGSGKSVRKVAEEWLEEHRSEYNNLSNEAIDRIATMTNWDKKGGAPKTPG